MAKDARGATRAMWEPLGDSGEHWIVAKDPTVELPLQLEVSVALRAHSVGRTREVLWYLMNPNLRALFRPRPQ